jgi:exodeoxyribonuclease V alpha subunit
MTTEVFTFQVGEIKFAKEGFHIVRTTHGESVSGKFAARIGHCYKAEGKWVEHPVYGPEYKLTSAVSVRITSAEALGRFLSLQLKGKGIGEVVIGALVAACKEDNLNLEELLDKNQRETLVECVGKRNEKKVDILLGLWPTIKPKADLVSPLLGYGLSEAMAESAIALWGKSAVEYVEEHPYDLILHLDGVSFLTADRIAMKVGRVGKTDALRLRAALSTGLQQATSNGDIGVKRKLLLNRTRVLVNESKLEGGKRVLVPGVPLAVSDELLEQTLDDMIAGRALDETGKECGFSSQLAEFPDAKGEIVVWYLPLVEAEKTIARRMALFNAPPLPRSYLADIDKYAIRIMGKPLAARQSNAIEMVWESPISIVTGGPGTGKSTMLKTLLAMFDSLSLRGALVAPTGKAAKRITEATGRPAQTIHSLIGWNGGSTCAFDESCPMTYQYLVIDEGSMVDTELMAMTLTAAANGCRVIILGDVDQLASVGPGQVLRDCINSGVLPVTRLTKGFRFSGGIAEAARAINSGHMPESSDDGQFVFVETESPAQDLLEVVRTLLKDGVNENDIQVLAPTHKNDAGCTALNLAMQAYLNPERTPGAAARLKRDSGDIRAGDRVIQTKNDKELKLVNGDIGWLDDIPSDAPLSLSLPDRSTPVLMSTNQAQHLKLAYAITVHKSQGAEAPFVLLALDSGASFMLRRNLVYTGVTRASQRAYVFASRSTFTRAVRMGEPPEGSRRTSLVSKLEAAFAGRPRPVVKADVEEKVPNALAQSMLLTADMPDVQF